MRSTLKLNKAQLRSIIKEAINEVKPANDDIEVRKDAFINAVRESFVNNFDPGDPSQANSGQAAWETEIESAILDLTEKVDEALSDVSDMLMNGEYSETRDKEVADFMKFRER